MNCREASTLVHGLLDGELSAELVGRVEEHLSSCAECAQVRTDLAAVKDLISGHQAINEVSSRQIWADLQRRRSRNYLLILREWFEGSVSALAEMESRTVLARLTALPLTVIGFLVLAAQFPRVPTQELTYPVFLVPAATLADTSSNSRPVMMRARQARRELHGLIDTVWRIPYEDSLSLVAQIGPGGNATIGDVLEYPRNEKLLDAAAASLQDLQFDPSALLADSFLIYSIKKVDVYEGRGL